MAPKSTSERPIQTSPFPLRNGPFGDQNGPNQTLGPLGCLQRVFYEVFASEPGLGPLRASCLNPAQRVFYEVFAWEPLQAAAALFRQTPAYTSQSFCLGERPADDAVEVEVGGDLDFDRRRARTVN